MEKYEEMEEALDRRDLTRAADIRSGLLEMLEQYRERGYPGSIMKIVDRLKAKTEAFDIAMDMKNMASTRAKRKEIRNLCKKLDDRIARYERKAQ